MEDVIGRIAREAHVKSLENSYAPSATMVLRTFNDLVERNAYNLIYKDITLEGIEDERIHNALTNFKCCHSYFGDIHYDAQNIVFKSMIDDTKLLTCRN